MLRTVSLVLGSLTVSEIASKEERDTIRFPLTEHERILPCCLRSSQCRRLVHTMATASIEINRIRSSAVVASHDLAPVISV